jgi:hypothetical protein
MLAIESLEALREAAAKRQRREDAASCGRAFPAEDTPLQVPGEVERLRGESFHPERA